MGKTGKGRLFEANKKTETTRINSEPGRGIKLAEAYLPLVPESVP